MGAPEPAGQYAAGDVHGSGDEVPTGQEYPRGHTDVHDVDNGTMVYLPAATEDVVAAHTPQSVAEGESE